MKILQAEHGKRSYPVYVGSALLARRGLLAPHVGRGGVVVVSNAALAKLYLPGLERTLHPWQPRLLLVPDGERSKSLEQMEKLVGELLRAGVGRDSTLVALGGGVIGDLTGFTAACYQRGLDYIQVPTTLLAQVDAAVGGKTAVNHVLGKNMIGAFHQPVAVLADIEVLGTLPTRALHAGLAEVIKYGLIRDAEFFSWLEKHLEELMALHAPALDFAIERSCRNKLAITCRDEREGGERALLNLGHSFAHAIETAQAYADWLHGEAVGLGLLLAADLSHRMGLVPADLTRRVETLLECARLPRRLPANLAPEHMRKLMSADKKKQAGRLRLVLLRALGDAFLSADFSEDALRATLEHHVP